MNDLEPRPPRGPAPGAVLGGLIWLALAVAVAAHQVLGLSWDWKVWAAGVLVLAGFSVVLGSVVAAARSRR